MEPNLWSETSVWVQLVYNVLLIVLPTLIGLAVVSEGGRVFVSRLRAFWKVVRPAIDETTDPVIMLLAQKSGRRPEAVRDFLLGEMDKVMALLPQEAVK